MLAQNFKSATDLGITEPQKEALMKTLVLLETEQLSYVQEFPVNGLGSMAFTGHFNMRSWASESDCGTVRCIGGTACAISGDHKLFDNWEYNFRLSSLFAPSRRIAGPWSRLTPAQAATALRSYLTCGDAKWHEAVA